MTRNLTYDDLRLIGDELTEQGWYLGKLPPAADAAE